MDAAIFLDRDNTLIVNDGDLGTPGAVRLMDGVAPGLHALREAGYRLIVVTNQAGVARGVFTEDDVDAVHQRIAALVDEEARGHDIINRFYYCPFHPEAAIDHYRRDHPWRKPHPGMLLQAARDMNLDLASCWMVGDQTRDIEAGRSAGCRTVLITENPALAESSRPTAARPSFSAAVEVILRATPGSAARGAAAAGRRPATPKPPRPAGGGEVIARRGDLSGLEKAITDLTDEIRNDRARRVEFTGFRLAAGMCQLLAVMLAVLGLLQLGSDDLFFRWMAGAVLVQLLTIAILLLDASG